MKFKSILLAALVAASTTLWAETTIRISTDETDLVFKVAETAVRTGDSDFSGVGRLYQSYFGPHLTHEADLKNLPLVAEAFLTHGMEDYYEPALDVRHVDGNPSTLLKYVSHNVSTMADGAVETAIVLKDPVYNTQVVLHFAAYQKENVIKAWTEITNNEKKPVKMAKYASSMLHLTGGKYNLTEFSGNWANEAHPSTTNLTYGKKIVDTKLGARANLFTPPMFMLSIGDVATEREGQVLLGQLGWTGNFRFTFEMIENDNLRVISGINPYFSEYELKAGATFTTPYFFFTLSQQGLGKASRDLHDWARRYQLKDGSKNRLTLLNNWEATYFNFDEDKLIGLMDDAVKLGVDMFLLDDGWFGNKYPRHGDTQGLGDWDETENKLPGKVSKLCEEAKNKGIKFGIWIEPEMVNPKSELYEKHKDWVIVLPNRDEYHFRNQLVLDLANPKVQDFVFGVVDNLMTKYPDIAFLKWDCNSPITNIYSPYLKDKQQHLYVDYVLGLYSVLDRVKAKYPELPMMLCSGGSGRIDYEALSYFTEFWPSDNTDPLERLYIQYAYSYFYPVKTECCHVTTWNKTAPIKYKVDVASQGKLGFDIKLTDMSGDDLLFCQEAVKNYKQLRPTIMEGDLYRLVSPFDTKHSVNQYVNKAKTQSVVFSFNTYPDYAERNNAVRLEGLDPNRMYKITEINLMPGKQSWLKCNDKVYSGDYLMKVGIDILTAHKLVSHVLLVEAQ